MLTLLRPTIMSPAFVAAGAGDSRRQREKLRVSPRKHARLRYGLVRLSADVAVESAASADVDKIERWVPEGTEPVDQLERRTKIVCTIGPTTCSYENLLRLSAEGMNLVRLNMSHGDYKFHKAVLDSVKKINARTPYIIGSMVDLGSLDMVKLGEFSSAPHLSKGEEFTLTVRHEVEYDELTSEVSYDGFIEVAEVGDLIQINDNVELIVASKNSTDVVCEVIKGGQLTSRAPIIVRGKSYSASTNVPTGDLELATSEDVDFVSLSFVEDAASVEQLRSELRDRGCNSGVVAKVETPKALQNIESIVEAADAIMIARGDLGTSIAFEKVPLWQERITKLCRECGKPVLVSTHFLDSMVAYPTPTRAEITDIFEAVRQKADALVLTTETASGRYPYKALNAMHVAAKRMESKAQESAEIDPIAALSMPLDKPFQSVLRVAENIANSASIIANQQLAKAIVVFTQKGLMASLVSRNRPNAPILAFAPTAEAREKLTLVHGVRPFLLEFSDDPEHTIAEAFKVLVSRGWLESGDLVIIVADVLGGRSGAPDSEKRAVFDEVAEGSAEISSSRVRAALRKMSLKATDTVEFKLAHGDTGTISYEEFAEVASNAKQIVHTVQLRYCP